MYDRNVEFPRRYRMVKVDGTDDVYEMLPAPGDVYEEGTMINKATLLTDETAAMFGLGADAVPDDVFSAIRGPGAIVRSYPISSGQTVTAGQVVDVVDGPSAQTVALSTLAEGSIIYLNESGSAVPFYVAKHDYESGLNGAGRTLVVRREIYQTGQWNSANTNAYANSTIDTWFNSTYKALLDSDVQSAIETTQFYYTPGNGNTTVTTISRAVFALSLTEFGLSDASSKVEGSKVPIAEMLYGSGISNQWTRSPVTTEKTVAFQVTANGANQNGCLGTSGYRTCFTLPGTFQVSAELGKFATPYGTPSQAIALQSGNSGDTIPVIFSGVAQLSGVTQGQQITSTGVYGYGALDGWLSVFPWWRPGNIVSGTYVGTGGFGGSSPNSLVFNREPLAVIVSGTGNGSFVVNFMILDSSVPISAIESGHDSSLRCSKGKTTTWYSLTSEKKQGNVAGATYSYFAILP